MFNLLIIIFLPLISSLCVAQFAWFTGRQGSTYLSTLIMFNFLIIIFLPLISSLCVAQFAWFTGRQGSAYLSTFIMFITALLSFILFCGMAFHRLLIFTTLGSWIYSYILEINWGFYFYNRTVTMLLVVTIISFLVHLYSIDYMSQDPHLPRFMSYLSLFTFFILILVTGDNFIVLCLGREGVGLCSYLLISFIMFITALLIFTTLASWICYDIDKRQSIKTKTVLNDQK